MGFKPLKILEAIGKGLLSVISVLPKVLIKGVEAWAKNLAGGIPGVIIELAAEVVAELDKNKDKSGAEKREEFLRWIEAEARARGVEITENLARGLLEMLVAELKDKEQEEGA